MKNSTLIILSPFDFIYSKSLSIRLFIQRKLFILTVYEALDPVCRKQHASHCKALGWDSKIGCPVECPEIKKCEDCLTLDKFCLKENSKSCRSLGWHRTKGCPNVCSAAQPATCEACDALEKHCQKLHNKSCRLFFFILDCLYFKAVDFQLILVFFFFLIFPSH